MTAMSYTLITTTDESEAPTQARTQALMSIQDDLDLADIRLPVNSKISAINDVNAEEFILSSINNNVFFVKQSVFL
jgi:hypothetical protein